MLSFILTQEVAVFAPLPGVWTHSLERSVPIRNEGGKGRVIIQGCQIPRVEHSDFVYTNVTLRRKDKNISMKILQDGEDKKILIPYSHPQNKFYSN